MTLTDQRATQSRLSVNINDSTARILAKYKDEYQQSATETVRQALAYYEYFKEEQAKGRTIQTVGKEGNDRRDVVFL